MSKLRAFTMPKWGIEMTEGTLTEWLVREGDRLTRGQVIANIETEKITNEVEAEYEAILARIIATEGSLHPVGALLAVLATEECSPAELDAFVSRWRPDEDAGPDDTSTATGPDAAPGTELPPAPAAPASIPAIVLPDDIAISPAARRLALTRAVDVRSVTGSGRDGRITLQDVDQASKPAAHAAVGSPVDVAPTTASLDHFYASPYAKRLAARNGIDLVTITATGPRGRISRHDVEQRLAQSPAAVTAAAAPEVVRMSLMRKTIARQLTLSKSTIPHFYLRHAVRVDALLATRERARDATGHAPSVNDYLIRATALALREVPDVNIQVHGEEIHRFPHADIAVAVATDKGLITPIVWAADTRSVTQIGAEVRALAERARAMKLRTEEFSGGSFTISNLGMFGIDQFDAIINPPQGAILAVGAARREPVERDYALAFATVVNLSLSCDHRAIDGAVGARFMAALRAYVEAPERL